MAGAWQNGVLMHYWYRALDRIVSPATNPASVLKKICCDEAVFAPQVRTSSIPVAGFCVAAVSVTRKQMYVL
jgi:hypothetical protein